MALLESFGDDIWIADGSIVESAGFKFPTRMAVIRLDDGGLLVWSPVAISDPLRAEVDALGPVRAIVTPTAMHSVSLTAWKDAYPNAVLYAAPGSRKRSRGIAFDADLSDEPPSTWREQIDQVLVRGNLIATEAVFFHRKSGTALFADLLQNYAETWFSGANKMIARMDGMIGAEPRTPQKFRFAFFDRKLARASIAEILWWPAQKVVMAHGTPVTEDAQEFLRRAFFWLTR